MIRRIQMNINYANISKLNLLDDIMIESQKVVQSYIDQLWDLKDFKSKFVDFKVETWLSARMQQCLGKQALEIVKSQRKRKKKTKPVFKSNVINFDSRFADFRFDQNTFDTWIKVSSIGNKISLKLPSKKHKHFNKLIGNGWNLKKSSRLRKREDGKYFIDFYVEKPQKDVKKDGRSIGIDCGYKKLAITSDNQLLDVGLENVYEKIARKKQGSKAFKRSLIERDNKINQSLNQLETDEINKIVVEDLKNVKKNTKGKIYKKFNNKLQRWSYTKVLMKLHSVCLENGIEFVKINPRNTSRKCSSCGFTDKSNRNGERFICKSCGFEIDADLNASINILHKGVYSPLGKEK